MTDISHLETYLVGGAVRDELLGQAVADRDWVVVGTTPDAMIELGFTQIGKEFPCFLHPESKEEYALARTERKSGSGHTGFICDFNPEITLEQDLIRRDLTINAIAKAPDGTIIDPYGGQEDLANGILKHVSDAFVEDPLRVLRVARFAARFGPEKFSVHKDTLALMTKLAEQGELETLTAERVWKEVSRALTEPYPSEFFKVLKDCGALQVILPELAKLDGVPQPAEHHPEIDTFVHVMLCIDFAARQFNDPLVTFATLLHDLGKGVTPETEWPRHIRHEFRGVPLVTDVCRRLKVPKEYLTLARMGSEYHLKCHTLQQLKPITALKLLEQLDSFRKPERVTNFARVCESDARGRLGLENRPYPQAQLLQDYYAAAKQVDVKSLVDQGLKGEAFGEALRKQRAEAIQAVKLNSE